MRRGRRGWEGKMVEGKVRVAGEVARKLGRVTFNNFFSTQVSGDK